MPLKAVARLNKIPLFIGMAPEVLDEIAAQCEVHEHTADTVIFREGDRAGELYLVTSGEVVIEKATEEGSVVLALLRPATCFGDMSLFDKAPRSATARARTDCTLVSLSGDLLRPICRRHPELYENIIQILSRRLRQTDARLAALG